MVTATMLIGGAVLIGAAVTAIISPHDHAPDPLDVHYAEAVTMVADEEVAR